MGEAAGVGQGPVRLVDLKEVQADLARRCPNSVHVTVPHSTHVIQLDQPAAVVDAIRQVIMAVPSAAGAQFDGG